MAGTPAGEIEAWAGPLTTPANHSSRPSSPRSLVLALCNRGSENGTVVTAPLSLLMERNGFWSFAMLPPRAARASGYARSVDHTLAGCGQTNFHPLPICPNLSISVPLSSHTLVCDRVSALVSNF